LPHEAHERAGFDVGAIDGALPGHAIGRGLSVPFGFTIRAIVARATLKRRAKTPIEIASAKCRWTTFLFCSGDRGFCLTMVNLDSKSLWSLLGRDGHNHVAGIPIPLVVGEHPGPKNSAHELVNGAVPRLLRRLAGAETVLRIKSLQRSGNWDVDDRSRNRASATVVLQNCH